MNDPYGLELSGLTPELSAEAAALARRQKVAEAMGMQAQQPLQTNRMAGGYVVPINPLEGIAKLVQSYSANKNLSGLDAQRQDIARRGREAVSAEIARVQGIGADKPGEVFQPLTPNDDEGNPLQPAQGPTVPGDKRRMITEAIMSPLPQVQKYGQIVAGQEQARDMAKMQQEQRQWETTQRAKDKIEQIQEQAAQGRITKAEADARSADLRRELQANQLQSAKELRAMTGALSQTKAPPGYRMLPDGSMEAIKGGPADTKLTGALNADKQALEGSISGFDRLAVAANETLNHAGLQGITGVRGKIPNIPGSAAADAQAKLNTLKSQVGFGVLQDMRNNSKTGGALGSVSDAEGKRLEANLAALENAQSVEQMRDSLKKIVQYAEDAKGRVRSAYNMKHGDKAPAAGAGDWAVVR